jgi:hypothetical protein
MGARIAGALMVAALAGCGGSSSERPSQQGVGQNVGAPINLADCTDWEQADTSQRLGTVRELRNFAGGPVVGANGQQGRGRVLKDEDAYDLLENYCENDFARGFKLYKLYERSAAFRGE